MARSRRRSCTHRLRRINRPSSISISSRRLRQVILQKAKSTWYGCQIAPEVISAVPGSKSTTREMSIPSPTWRHTPLVVGNFDNGYDEATRINLVLRTLLQENASNL